MRARTSSRSIGPTRAMSSMCSGATTVIDKSSIGMGSAAEHAYSKVCSTIRARMRLIRARVPSTAQNNATPVPALSRVFRIGDPGNFVGGSGCWRGAPARHGTYARHGHCEDQDLGRRANANVGAEQVPLDLDDGRQAPVFT